MFRTVERRGGGAARGARRSSGASPIEHVLEVPPVRMTDRARLRHRGVSVHDRHSVSAGWGEPLLFGPGSIHVAHTADEFVSIAELARGGRGTTCTIARKPLVSGSSKVQRYSSTGASIRAPNTTAASRAGASGSRRSIASTFSSPTSVSALAGVGAVLAVDGVRSRHRSRPCWPVGRWLSRSACSRRSMRDAGAAARARAGRRARLRARTRSPRRTLGRHGPRRRRVSRASTRTRAISISSGAARCSSC